jgi:tetratricopeptide (TPR) repeat protein
MYAGEVERAEIIYQHLQQKQPDSEVALFGLAFAALLQGRGEDAAPWVDSCLSAHPDSPRCLRVAGMYRAQARDPEGAAEAWSRALEVAPEQPEVLSGAATFYVDQSDYERAEGLFQRALELEPDVGDHRFLMADLAMRQSQPKKALQLLDEASNYGFKDRRLESASWLLRGWAHLVLGERALSSETPDVSTAKSHFAAMEAALGRAESSARFGKQDIERLSGNLRRRADMLRANMGDLWKSD